MTAKILVLAGTSEARQLTLQLSDIADLKIIASLAGATRTPTDLGVETRVGGFGGTAGLATYITQHKIDAIVDATHPFASQMTTNAANVASDLDIPHVILQRPEWQAQSGDLWYSIDKPSQAHGLISQDSTVFMGVGRQTLMEFECLADRRLLARVIDKPTGPFPFPNGAYVVGKPPFTIEEEMDFFRTQGIETLVVKNAGGTASRSKLEAARAMGLPVVMMARPALPSANSVSGVEDCLAWVKTLI